MKQVFEAASCELSVVAGGRLLRLRSAGLTCLLEGWQGPLPPALLTGVVVDLHETGDCELQAGEGRYLGRISGHQLLESAPTLLEPLVRPFELGPLSRRVSLALLGLLRLPGGSALLRAWHERRG